MIYQLLAFSTIGLYLRKLITDEVHVHVHYQCLRALIMYIIILDFIYAGSWAIAKEEGQLRQLYHNTEGDLSITYREAKLIMDG